jgi:hypothetical protein
MIIYHNSIFSNYKIKFRDDTLNIDSSVIDICKYLFFVLCILLIISGIEINPGPSVASESSSSILISVVRFTVKCER